jgi:hypothetical protein
MKIIGLEEFKKAIKQNPETVRREVNNYFVRSLDSYTRIINTNPWTMGGSGGGSPVRSTNLKRSHEKQIGKFEARIFVNESKAPYAPYVHGLNGQRTNKRGVQLRPWLDYAKSKGQRDVDGHLKRLADEIIKGLAK